MSVDVRTRVDGDEGPVDPAVVLGADLPAAFAAAGWSLAGRAGALRLALLTIEVGDGRWTLASNDGGLSVTSSDVGADVRADAATSDRLRLRLSAEQLAELVRDQATPMTWFAGGTLDLDGRLERLLDWWTVIRGALDGRLPHAAGDLALEGLDGSPLDLQRRFRASDDPGKMRQFLAAAGFLHIGGLYGADEMAAVSADMDRAAPTYAQGDGRSWWARTADGADRLVRMQGFDRESPAVAGFLHDGRLSMIGALTGDGHQVEGESATNRIEALEKPIGVVAGISDVPWHKDCSLGRHSYDCCSLTVGISVTGADDRSGQLRVVAGSHRALMWPALMPHNLDLPQIDLPTRTGDATVHLSCTMHMAQPPVDRERRVLYTSLRLPARGTVDHESRQRLRSVREAAPVTVSQPPSKQQKTERRTRLH